MNVSMILAHPDPGSFNHAIAKTAYEQARANKHTVFFHDLHAELFDPLSSAGKRALRCSTQNYHEEMIST
ncbi:MAG: NAD(P)H-dependent oxidoreductase [Nitrospiraceae bacterium]|jgi:putative NADPH-quinone reductase|nr:NAD(P)H-dependent oxidoreductase [Nitrospiraceae bacterium]